MSVFSNSLGTQVDAIQLPMSHKSLLAYSSRQYCVCHMEVSDRFVNKTAIKWKKYIFSSRRTFSFICAQTTTSVYATKPNEKNLYILMFCDARTIRRLSLLLHADDGVVKGPHNSFSFSFASIDLACLLKKPKTCARPIFSFLFSFVFLSADCVWQSQHPRLHLIQIRNSFTEHISRCISPFLSGFREVSRFGV